jgi:pilus assembly protein Flp/PilA
VSFSPSPAKDVADCRLGQANKELTAGSATFGLHSARSCGTWRIRPWALRYFLRALLAICACIPDMQTALEMRKFFSDLINDRSGVTAIEYALIAALIAVAAIAAFTLVGTNLSTTFSYVASQL